MLNSGVNVNQKTANGTALHTACAYGRVQIVKLLLKSGADLKIKDSNDKTPRYYAKYYNRRSVVDLIDKRLKTNLNRSHL